MAVHDHVKGIKRADELMDYETAMSVFNALVEEGKKKCYQIGNIINSNTMIIY